MNRVATLAACATLIAAPAQAGPVEDIPYVKAEAYALAIEKWCFGDPFDKRLESASARQRMVFNLMDWPDVKAIREQAEKHLMSDQTACGPARDFVGRTLATLPNDELGLMFSDWLAKLKTHQAAFSKVPS